MKRLLLAATLLALPLAARAQPIQGLYVGAGVGANFMQDTRVRVRLGSLPGPTLHGGFDTGVTALGSVGWGFGNGVRVEAEGSWRRNTVGSNDTSGLSGAEKKIGAMANVLFDMDIGSPYVFPYLGAGAGAQWVKLNWVSGSVTAPPSPTRPWWAHRSRSLVVGLSAPPSIATWAWRGNGSSRPWAPSRPMPATTTTTR